MPGIVGLITRMPHEKALARLARMADSIRHESFYSAGTWIDAGFGVYAAWTTREDLSPASMPLRSERGDVNLLFSGEEFPEPAALQAPYNGRGRDEADLSYLMRLYEGDAAFPAGLNGRFHGLLTDRSRGIGMLFNDRYGMHRMYYHEGRDGFYFACEAKAILAAEPELRAINSQALGEYISCGCVLENRTLFKGIGVLPGGSAWIFRSGSLERKASYFDSRQWEEQEALDAESFYTQLQLTFAQNLPRYFNGRQRIAMSLTGGLDTRMIMAWRKAEPGSLPCYTFGGMLRECQDVTVARRLATSCGQPHTVIPVKDEFLSRFSHYAERTVYLTDGCVDVSRSPDLYLNENARLIAPVRMTGNYGGEVMRRVRGFKPTEPIQGLFHDEVLGQIRRAEQTYRGLIQGHPVSFAVFKQGPWHHCGVLGLEQTQISLRSPFLDNDFVRTLFRAPQSAFASTDVSLRLIADGNAALSKIPTDRGLAGGRGRLLETVSHRLLEFQFKAEYAYDMGMPQWVARADHMFRALHLERLFLGRHKIFHFRVWYRDALAAYLRETLLDPRSLSRGYINPQALKSIVQGHLKGDWNYTNEIHKLLTLELIHRLFLDHPERGGSENPAETRYELVHRCSEARRRGDSSPTAR